MSAEWELYYWPGFPGRGEFVRLMFEEAGVKYKENTDANFIKEQVCGGQLPGFPSFAPPVIRKGDFYLSITPVICKYLGKKFGLYPDSDEDQLRAEQFNLLIHDFVMEGNLVFHGRNFHESYYTQKEETKPYVEWFKKERFQKWMGTLERLLAYNNGGNGFAVGTKLTYVDLALLQVLRAASASFPDKYQSTIGEYPLIKAHRERTENRPNLQAFFKSDRSLPMADHSMM